MFVLDDILLAPLNGVLFIAKKLAERVDLEESDEATIMKQLLEVQLLYEMDEISEEEYEAREAVIIAKLKRVKEAQNEYADEDEDEDEEILVDLED
jgi:hypothetical protein